MGPFFLPKVSTTFTNLKIRNGAIRIRIRNGSLFDSLLCWIRLCPYSEYDPDSVNITISKVDFKRKIKERNNEAAILC